MSLEWEFIIDWDNDGSLEASEEEQDRLRSFKVERGRPGLFVGSAAGASLGRMQVGSLHTVMDNQDQRYDPWYTSSPLYPNVMPGRLGSLRCNYSSTWYDLFKGYLDEPDSSGHKHDKIASLPLSDGWRILTERPMRELALQEDKRTDQIISAMLTAISWPSALGSDLATGSDIIEYFWGGGVSVYDLLHEIAEEEFGLVYIPGDGKLHFDSRHSLFGVSSVTTITDDEVSGDPIIEAPWDAVRNYIMVAARPLTLLTTGDEVWKLRDTPQVGVGQTITIWAQLLDSYNRPSPCESIRMTATTDWTANTSADGTGADMTSFMTVTPTLYGSLVKIQITNGSTYPVYIDYMRIWSAERIELLATSEWVEEDTTSQSTYRRKDFAIDDNPWIQSSLHAMAYAQWIASWAGDPKPQISITIEQRPDLQLAIDIGDVITYNSAKLGINDQFRIGKIVHRSGVNMQQIFTDLLLEPFQAIANYWKIGITGRSEIGQKTYVVF